MDLAPTAGVTAQPYAPWPNNLVVRIGNICHWLCGSLSVKAMCPFPPQILAEGRFENRTAMYLHAFAVSTELADVWKNRLPIQIVRQGTSRGKQRKQAGKRL